MTLYEINLQREILREKSAEILGMFYSYMNKNNIEEFNDQSSIGILKNTVSNIYRNIFDAEYGTMTKIDEANGKLDLIKQILNDIYLI